jgi:uncharacterized protein (TIGR00661 family)
LPISENFVNSTTNPRKSKKNSEDKIKRIAYYISAHGYGHAARSIPVLRQLIPSHSVFIKSAIDCDFFNKHLPNNFEFISQNVDAGCQHSNSLKIDSEKSFQALKSFFKNSSLTHEKNWLSNNKIDLIISDVASMPLKVASQLKLPSILIGNFTWHDIYSHLPQTKNESILIQSLAEEYSHATVQILPQCHLNNKIIDNKKEVGFITNKGKNIRDDLEHHLGKGAENKTLVFIYLGEHGTHSVAWENLGEIKDCLFLTRDPIDHPAVNTLNEIFTYQDLIASSDIILTKGGYSTLSTAFANHKPVITCERNDFYEFEAIREYLQIREIGILIKDKQFCHGDWQEHIKEALKLTVKNKVPLNGEIEISKIIHQMLS